LRRGAATAWSLSMEALRAESRVRHCAEGRRPRGRFQWRHSVPSPVYGIVPRGGDRVVALEAHCDIVPSPVYGIVPRGGGRVWPLSLAAQCQWVPSPAYGMTSGGGVDAASQVSQHERPVAQAVGRADGSRLSASSGGDGRTRTLMRGR